MESLDVVAEPSKPVVKPHPREKSSKSQEDAIYENSAIAVGQFEDYVAQRKADPDDFLEEYETLPQEDYTRCEIAQTEDNKNINRFKNIFAYDDTRVVLHKAEEDYINANYISGYTGANGYIATQGPLRSTAADFWQMIWQEKANTIVMVANLVENMKNRCCQYWPEKVRSSKTFGAFHVRNEAAETTADYTTTNLSVEFKNESRTVRHFHFKTWIDKNKPLYGPTGLLAFYRKVHAFDHLRKGPMVVHCSAGVGRTGTFIILHILMQQVIKEKKVDVYGWAMSLRRERMFMVQTVKQYVFTHDVIVEFIKCRDIPTPCIDYNNRYPHSDITSDVSPIRKQFEILKTMNIDSQPNTDKDGVLDFNINKNRNRDVIPDTSDHPYLPGRQEDSYINAVFVDSFILHDFIIVTQMPLPHTIPDFWRLIHNQQTQAIIMLNQLKEDENSYVYWPQENTAVYGGIEVTVTNTTKISEAVAVRDFTITKRLRQGQKSETHSLKQFQMLRWPEASVVPPIPTDLFELMEHIDRMKIKFYEKASANVGTLVVHCLDGVNHSGMFCALKYMIDKMKLEQEVDPFLAARYVSRRRPEFFQRTEQYQFLHKMTKQYLTGYSEYVNVQ